MQPISQNTKRTLVRTAVVLAVLFAAIQFVPCSKGPKNDAPVRTINQSDVGEPRIVAILNRSCLDCHSDQTHWPWYSRIAPASWILHRDVKRGRAKLNFSQWSKPPAVRARMEICDAVSDGSMPLPAYALLHHDARLSKQDVASICQWASDSPTRTLKYARAPRVGETHSTRKGR